MLVAVDELIDALSDLPVEDRESFRDVSVLGQADADLLPFEGSSEGLLSVSRNRASSSSTSRAIVKRCAVWCLRWRIGCRCSSAVRLALAPSSDGRIQSHDVGRVDGWCSVKRNASNARVRARAGRTDRPGARGSRACRSADRSPALGRGSHATRRASWSTGARSGVGP